MGSRPDAHLSPWQARLVSMFSGFMLARLKTVDLICFLLVSLAPSQKAIPALMRYNLDLFGVCIWDLLFPLKCFTIVLWLEASCIPLVETSASYQSDKPRLPIKLSLEADSVTYQSHSSNPVSLLARKTRGLSLTMAKQSSQATNLY